MQSVQLEVVRDTYTHNSSIMGSTNQWQDVVEAKRRLREELLGQEISSDLKQLPISDIAEYHTALLSRQTTCEATIRGYITR